MSDYYQLTTVNDVQQDSQQILAILTDIKNGARTNDLRLLNYYRSIPVNYGATVEHIDGDVVELAVQQQQAIVMQMEKQTFIKSDHFPKDVLAAVSYINIDKCRALVSKFAYAVIRAERRQFVRVEVRERIEVGFTATGATFNGTLHDISIGGLAVAAELANPPEDNLVGTVTLKLPDTPCEMPAKLLRRIEVDDRSLFIMETRPNARAEKAISQFIFQRQVEIIRELKDSIF
ncbi:pilus protein PilZ [Geotalea uraniireducens]|uniref:Pilus protein PilZ n=1 Tax=Geotalea uraniireducens TaxID=351604 RepID=A0ABN6VZC6_9BACT|nr:PilZ domain-containing protein [Geotalea uraniireducens]BDV44705.1 pilus protein PilZ [Geotalea uraniireducens]